MPDVASGQVIPDWEVPGPRRPYPRSRQEVGSWPDYSSRLGSGLLLDDLFFIHYIKYASFRNK